MILKNRTGSAGTEESFKNVRYSTINDENKYKSKDYLFICFQTTIMLNKREKNYFIISLYLFILFYFIYFLLLFYFFPLPFSFYRFNFVVSERNMHSFLPTFLGGTFFSLLDVSKRNIFSGGRVVCARARSAHPPPPPCVRAW